MQFSIFSAPQLSSQVPDAVRHVFDTEELRDAVFSHLPLHDRATAARVSVAWSHTALRSGSWDGRRAQRVGPPTDADAPRFALVDPATQTLSAPISTPQTMRDGLRHYASWASVKRIAAVRSRCDQAGACAQGLGALFIFVLTHQVADDACTRRSCGGNPPCEWNRDAYCASMARAPAVLAAASGAGLAVALYAGVWSCFMWILGAYNTKALALDAAPPSRFLELRTAARLGEHLHKAIAAGQGEHLGQLLACGAPVNAIDAEGRTPLQCALNLGCDSDAFQLVRCGAAFGTADLAAAKSACPLAATEMQTLLDQDEDEKARSDGAGVQ